MIKLHFFHLVLSIVTKEDGYIAKYIKYYKFSKKREQSHLKLLKNAILRQSILIAIRIQNPDRDLDHPQNATAYPTI